MVFLFQIHFILLYCKVQKNNKACLLTNVQKIILHILAINKKILCSEFTDSIQKYECLIYKLLHFAAAVH